MRLLNLLLFVFFSWGLAAQDMQFYHFYSSTLYLNPAFAGAYQYPDISFTYQNKWPSSTNNSLSYSLSYNHNLKKNWGGFGFYWLRESVSDGLYINESIHLSYSPSFKVFKKFILKPALDGAYGRRNVDWDKLRFPPQQQPIIEILPLTERNYFDFSAGILIYDSVFNAGIAVHHINEPDIGFYAWDEEPLATKVTFHINRDFKLDERGNFILSPYYIFKTQSDFVSHSFNINVKMYCVSVGAGYQGNDDYSFMFGLSSTRFRLSYTYYVNSNNLENSTAGSHEFFASYILCSEKLKSDKTYISRVAF